MGNLLKPYGIERIFDKSINNIDLRAFLKTDINGNSNVFIWKKDNNSDEYLMIIFIEQIFSLGKIIDKEYPDKYDPNVCIIKTDNNRKYIVSPFLNYINIDNLFCKFIDDYIV